MKTWLAFWYGIFKNNPTFRLVLGLCPTLAVTTSLENALGMGLAASFVLVCSNGIISALRKLIPAAVHIPCYIVIVATFVTATDLLMQAYLPALSESLGIFIPLIVVNCIILGRAEAFANKHGVLDSALDAIGMGLGFTLTLFVMASIREIFGNGTWMGLPIPVLADNHISILTMAPGGFFVFGCLIACVNKWFKNKPKKKDFGCEGCPSASLCQAAGRKECEAK